MEILKEYEHENKEIGVNTDEYLLNQKLNELYNKEKKKLEDDLKKHESVANAKPYQCAICKKNFSLEVTLKEHMLEHTIIKTEEGIEINKEMKENNNIDNKNNEDIKEEEKNNNNNNNKVQLGFFGRLMAPIFLTEKEINNINN